jgi:amino acid adenylation domain-containing protein
MPPAPPPSLILPPDHGGPTGHPFEPFPASALDATIVDRLAAIVRRYPDRLAVRDGARALTYRALAADIRRIARAVMAAAAGRDGPIGILLESNAQCIVAMFGVLAAGRAFVAMDAHHPPERNRLIGLQSGIAAWLSDAQCAAVAGALFPADIPFVDIGTLPMAGERPDMSSAMDAAELLVGPRPAPTDPAGIVFTSGSTGVPKGVAQSHRNLLHDTAQFTSALHLGADDRLTLLASPGVAAACRDIYGALLNGASLHMLSPVALGPRGLVDEIRARGITIYHSVPTVLRRLVAVLGPDDRLDSVRIAYLAGDRVEWSDVDHCRQALSRDVSVFVALGSTECVNSWCQWFVDDRLRSTTACPPVGRVAPGRALAIIGEDGAPAEDGETGEIVVTSRTIADGYWRAPELSAAAFAVHPDDPAQIVFRTGDLARRRADGLIELCGRKNRQVKLHGHRIEPQEIETILLGCPGVDEAAVHVRRGDGGIARALIAYVVVRPGMRGLLPRHLMALLSQRLPRHQLPAQIVFTAELPRLPSLKIDHARLDTIDRDRIRQAARGGSGPIGEVTEIFERVLGVSATVEDNVRSLGADSLQLMEIVAEIERRFGVAITPEQMADDDTIGRLAQRIAMSPAGPASARGSS